MPVLTVLIVDRSNARRQEEFEIAFSVFFLFRLVQYRREPQIG